ncbi:glycosyltransferase family 4 protein [Ammoniphilus resinae]|uniref:Glycosyltransferase involved in cell wall biosynthesis n=1 Tax=Ammoniphilus resinae TaxID=861532 RepID=A0ABS4GXI6_9BACL|nr:glycosyltransferase family 4 protein [Ammoniphilus resinae]MBP1934981.1 glycosyltransferase involved in cell wall biosynthesis [Ammoniphilus resinae]
MKILYVTTVSDTMGFFTSHINMLLEEGHTVDMACNIGKPINQELIDLGCNAYNIEFSRSPVNPSNIVAYKNLKKLIIEKGYDVVHTHTPVASVCVRLACKKLKNVRVMYTAHGFHFYKGAPLQNWLIYYSIEKWLSKYTDVLITINQEDFQRAKKSFKAGAIEYLPGVGIDINKFNNVAVDKAEKRRELGLPKDSFVVLSVGELNKNKNHETIIKAIAQLGNSEIYYVICGLGPLEGNLKRLANELGLGDRVKLLGFRKDINEIFKASDIFVFPSFREGLSVALMESMACGLPVVCSHIRGNSDLIHNNKGGFLIESSDVSGFAEAINNITDSKKLRLTYGQYNTEIIQGFNMTNVLQKLKKIYYSRTKH